MANVSQSAFSSSMGWITNDLSLVYSGTLNCNGAGQWNTLQLHTDFYWTGGCLLLVVDDNSGHFDGDSYVWYCTETEGNSVLRIASHETNYTLSGSGANMLGYHQGVLSASRPNTRFCIDEKCTRRAGQFNFSVDTVVYVAGSGDFNEPAIDTSSLFTSLQPYTGSVTYYSSNTAIASVDPITGEVSPTGTYGLVTIYATAVFGDYCPATASYVIDVTDECKQVGKGSTPSAAVPLSTDSRYSYSQMIYLPSDIGCGGKINSIAFESQGENSVDRTIEIYMGETDDISFELASGSAFVTSDSLQLVYSGPWSISDGWQTFALQSAFNYSGVHNLLVAVKSVASTHAPSDFACTSMTEYLTIFCHSDTYEPDPSAMSVFVGEVSRLRGRPNTRICIDCCNVRPTFQFDGTQASCYPGSDCPMLTLVNSSSAVVQYTSLYDSIATVDDGGITALEPGQTTITAMIEMSGDTCSAKASYQLHVLCPLALPSAADDTLCAAGMATLYASSVDGDELLWYDAEDAMEPVYTGNGYNVEVDVSTTFYVAAYSAAFDCQSQRLPVHIGVFSIDYEPTTQSITGHVNVPIYGYPPAGGTAATVYTASGLPAWITLNADGSFSGTPTAAGSGSFTVTATSGDCAKVVTIEWSVDDNPLDCCSPDAFYMYHGSEPLPIRVAADGFCYVDVCKGVSDTLKVVPLADGCTGYSYSWRLTSATGNLLDVQTSDQFIYMYPLSEGYDITLTINKEVPDACSLDIPIRVRVSGVFNIAIEPVGTHLCQGQALTVSVSTEEHRAEGWGYLVSYDTVWSDCGWPTTYSDGILHITPPIGFVGNAVHNLYIRDENGCIVTYGNFLDVSIYPTVGNIDTVTDQCDSYTWSRTGQNYVESGTYISNILTPHGCLDSDTLVLDLKHSYYIEKDTSVCMADFPFDWYGVHFVEPGTQVRNFYSIAGCDSTLALTVIGFPHPVLTLVNPANAGGCPEQDYVVHTVVVGGTAPYTYAWTGYTSVDDSLFVAVDTCGDISVESVVTDANGCTDTTTTVFTTVDNERPWFETPIAETDAIRQGLCKYLVPDLVSLVHPRDNCLIVSQLQAPPVNEEISGDTNVTLVVVDACGNRDSLIVLVRAPQTLTCSEIRQPAVDCPWADGSVYDLSVGVGGGVEPYTYQWRAVETGHAPFVSSDPVFAIRSDGACHEWRVSLTVSDATGCTVTPNPSPVLFNVSDIEGPHARSLTPSFELSPVEGSLCKYLVPDFTEWVAHNVDDNCTPANELVLVEQNPLAGDTVYGWRNDAYVVVKDRCGKTSTIPIILTVDPAYTISHQEYVYPSCPNDSNGAFRVFAVVGGQPPYTYSFRNESHTTTDTAYLFSNLYEGDGDTLTITDANGCMALNTDVYIWAFEPMSLHFSAIGANAEGADFKLCKDTLNDQTVTISVAVFGNMGEPAYEWLHNGVTDATLTLINPDSNSTGFYTVSVTDTNHCTATDSVKFSVYYPSVGTDEQTTCVAEDATNGSFRWYTSLINFNESDIAAGYVDGPPRSYSDVHGCTSQEVLHLVIRRNSTATLIFDTCDSYTWHGINYSATPTVARFDTINAAGCDSSTTLNLSLRYSSTALLQADVCDSYLLHRPGKPDTTFTESDYSYRFSTLNAAGCDSVTTLNLTVRHSSDSTVALSVCDSFAWHGVTYTESTTTATFDTLNAAGCDSTATLNLTVNHATSAVVDTSVCDSFVLHRHPAADTTFVASILGYRFTAVNTAGCDSTTTLNLTVRYGSDSLYRDTVCDSLRWPPWIPTSDATLFTVSTSEPYPSAIYPSLNVAGCDSTVYLALTVMRSTVIVDSHDVCDSLTWLPNGQTYTESTSLPFVVLGDNHIGCDSVLCLNLTIRHSSTGIEQADVCDTFLLHRPGDTDTVFTASDFGYQFTTLNSVGCDSTVTLNLTVRYSDTIHTGSDTICADGSFEWYGVDYNEQGTYLHLFDSPNSVGCDSMAAFTLIVHDTNVVYVFDTCAYLDLPWYYNERSYDYKVEDDIFEYQNHYGCDSTVHYFLQPVWRCEQFIQFPTVVTPNGDGVNDRFVVTNLLEGGCYPHNHLSIFNRWGFLVYDRENIQKDDDFWDPVDMPDGTYFFRFDGYGFDHKMERRGSFEIIRKP